MKFAIVKKTIAAGLMVFAALCVAITGMAEAADAAKFSVEFKAAQKSFKVGEPVRFVVKGNKDFYLYLFSLDEKANKSYVILPNKLQQYHKYAAGKDYIVPEKAQVEFIADKPGTEKVVLLASTEKLKIDSGKFAQTGKVLSGDADAAKAELKALRIQAAEKEKEQVVKELVFKVKGQPQKPAKAAAFISSDRTSYQVGDEMKITYGADKPGTVYLVYAGPDGKPAVLAKQSVDGKRFYQKKAKATKPSGSYNLAAIYLEKGELDMAKVKLTEGESGTKDIELVEEIKPLPMAVYRLEIKD